MAFFYSAAIVSAYGGMLALCFGVERYFKQVWQQPLSPKLRIVLRTMGWGALILSLLLCAQAWGWPMGSVAWFGMISLGGIVVALLLPYWPRGLIALLIVGVLFSTVLSVMN